MDDYLTVRHKIMCMHGGQFVFMPPPMHSLTVRNASVVTEEDILMRGMVMGCPQVGPGIKPCLKATTIVMGRTFNLITDRERPLEECFQAISDGVPPGMIYALPYGTPRLRAESAAYANGGMLRAAGAETGTER